MSDDDKYDSYWFRYLPESYEERRNMFLNENAQRIIVHDRLTDGYNEIINDEKKVCKKQKSSEIEHHKCPGCKKMFHMKVYSKKSAVMSIDCSHTICSECTVSLIFIIC